ncbi:hypothetical protein H2204_008545 [Knufia peltigerae]|uniref:G-patch domain-containing protein n=1 Tax=Knufia peltigerae TaxID=1002370 RepID=A0AA38Y045_9EURO|nr:hypothetical protein H2204_008545 [Knufia peltigerae]
MAANNASGSSRGGLSLYANLLDPKSAAPGTISSAPVSYSANAENSPDLDEAAKKQQALAASLRFQPTKRPQIANQKAKAKAIAAKFAPPSSTSPAPSTTQIESKESVPTTTPTPHTSAPRTTAADWTATASDDEDISNFYTVEKRQRGGRKKRKKNKEAVQIVQDWDDIYDPSRPNNYEEYKQSEEKVREVREWKDLLYRHRMKRGGSSESDGEDRYRSINRQFAPPPMSFAPPPNLNDESSPAPLPPPAPVPDDATGEDAYLRRMRMAQGASQPPPPPSPEVNPPPGQIARAPVRYNLPAAPEELPSTEAELEEKLADTNPGEDDGPDQPRSSRPGQAGFAERLMAKYGWSKGQGLGAQGTGIINPLYAKADKRKKKPDAEGGGYATPASTGKILGGNKSKAARAEEEGKFGPMSEVIRLEGMLNGLDLDEELTRGEGGILQEIGEECGEKYGSVERVYIHRPETEGEDALVFVHFVSQLSALRAVNALEGRIFNGNPIKAKFWPKERFDARDYV